MYQATTAAEVAGDSQAATVVSVAQAPVLTLVTTDDEATERAAERNRGRYGYRFVKRAFDITFSTAMLTLLSPLLLATAVAIKLETPGPAIFTQTRVGGGGREFKLYKFRSMYVDAHERPESYLTGEQMLQWRREQKVQGDPRVTKLGRMLRKTSLDEVPQFFNVLKGDMSVIGPRPVTMNETYEYGAGRSEVLAMRPGITGWWQVIGRNRATWKNGERQELELWYVQHASVSTDIKVFIDTFGTVLSGTGQ